MRVSDADRDTAVTELSEHFQAGRLTQDEFDERSGTALRARTGSDLSSLFADLPNSDAGARVETPQFQEEQAQQPEPMYGRPVYRRGPYAPVGLVVALAVIGIAGLGGGTAHHHPGWGLLIPIVVLWAVIARRAARSRHWQLRGTARR